MFEKVSFVFVFLGDEPQLGRLLLQCNGISLMEWYTASLVKAFIQGWQREKSMSPN